MIDGGLDGVRLDAMLPPRPKPRDVGEGAASIVATVLERATGGFIRDGQPIGW